MGRSTWAVVPVFFRSVERDSDRRYGRPERQFGDATNSDMTVALSGTSATVLKTLAHEGQSFRAAEHPTDATQLHGSDRSPQRRPLDQFDEDDNFGPTTVVDEYYATLDEAWLGVPAGDLLPGSPNPSSRKPHSQLAISA
jgi:hypothetical protein